MWAWPRPAQVFPFVLALVLLWLATGRGAPSLALSSAHQPQRGHGHRGAGGAGASAAERLWASRPAPPQSRNVTGTYRGDWSRLVWPRQLGAGGPLRAGAGVAALKLRNVGRGQGGVYSVEGEMVLRGGQYITAGDMTLSLQGVHVPAAGKIMAVVEPSPSLRLPPALSLGHALQQGWRAAVEHVEGWERRDRVRQATARQVAAAAEERPEGQSGGYVGGAEGTGGPEAPLPVPVPHDEYEEAMSWRRCGFVLELAVSQQQQQQQQQRQQQEAGAGGEPGAQRARRKQPRGGGAPGQRAAGASRRRLPLDSEDYDDYDVEDLEPLLSWRGGPVLLNGTLVSRTCGIRVAVNLGAARVDEYHAKAVQYTLMTTLVGLLQVLLLMRQMESATTPALASRVSLLTLAHQAVLDAYLCLVHLTLGIMIEALFHSFATVAFMQFVVFAVVEMRFLLSVWRARHSGLDAWAAQREISMLYARFYAALLGGILLTYQFQRHMPVLLFAFFSFWWPQIISCIRSDGRQPLRAEYVLGTSAARLALPMYIYACPSNLLRVEPDLRLCAALLAWVGLQCALLMAQRVWGPRCFIPAVFLPKRYDYGRPVPELNASTSAAAEAAECVICMGAVDLSSKAHRAVTPCSHIFHPACLEHWMVVKADCPVCRRPLPPL